MTRRGFPVNPPGTPGQEILECLALEAARECLEGLEGDASLDARLQREVLSRFFPTLSDLVQQSQARASQSYEAPRTTNGENLSRREGLGEPLDGLLSGSCYNLARNDEGAPQANAAGRSEEGCRADRQAPEGCGRGSHAQAEAEEYEGDLGLSARGLISLWQMLRQYAFAFYDLGISLEKLQAATAYALSSLKDAESQGKVLAKVREVVQDTLPQIRERIVYLDLTVTLRELDRWVNADGSLNEVSLEEWGRRAETLSGRITDELRDRNLLYVDSARANHYKNFRDNWKEALARFNIATDVEEAEKCFALGRFSGCVFHLMRVAEIGVQDLGRKLKLPEWKIQEPWGNIVKAVQDKVKGLPHKTKAQKKKQHAWSSVADALYQVNLAWRIPTEHPRVPGDSYSEEQAAEALGRVRALMRHLASVI